MKKNVGSIDRWLRIVLGLVIAILGVLFESWWGLISVILIGTAIFNFCPIWAIFKFSTNKKEA